MAEAAWASSIGRGTCDLTARSPSRCCWPAPAPGLNNLGVALERKGYWPLAVLTCQDALEIDPQLAAAHCNLGEIQAGSGSLDEAMACYKQAQDCDPTWTPARNTLRIPTQDEARLKEAIDHYRQAVRIEPYFAWCLWGMGQHLLARHEFTEAEAEFRRGLDLVPEAEKFHDNLKHQLQRCPRPSVIACR